MEKITMQEILGEFNVETDLQKVVLGELVFLVLSEPANNTGFNYEQTESLREFCFGDFNGSDLMQVVELAGFASNELAELFNDSVQLNESVWQVLFRILKNKETISGVVLP